MGKRGRVALVVAVFLGIALIGAGGAGAAAGFEADEPPESTLSTDTTLPTGSTDSTETTLPTVSPDSTETTLLPDSDTTLTTDAGSFGQIISALRHAGDHTPAAVIKGKKVPGWNSDKHATATTTTIVSPQPGSDSADGSGDREDEEEELGPNGAAGSSDDKDHVPAAVLKGKKVPGRSK